MITTDDGEVLGSIDRAALGEEEDDQAQVAQAQVVQDDQGLGESEELSKLHKADLVERAQAAGFETEGLTKAELVEALEGVNTEQA